MAALPLLRRLNAQPPPRRARLSRLASHDTIGFVAGRNPYQTVPPNAEAIVGTDFAGGGAQNRNVGIGFVCSAILHGLALLLLLLFVVRHDRNMPPASFRLVPVDVVQLGEETAAPPQQQMAPVPQQKAARRKAANPVPVGVAPEKKKPLPDELDTKLRALSKLRQPEADTRLEEDSSGASNMSATSEGAVSGPQATYSLRDFIRAQVERRWSLNLTALGSRNVSIPIRVEMTSRGVVNKAEIVDTMRMTTDRVYRDIAISARNAVLLSSPFALPPGQYDAVMTLTLNLNPKDTLR